MKQKVLCQYLELLESSGWSEIFYTPKQPEAEPALPLSNPTELDPDIDVAAVLAKLANQYATCTKCPLHAGRHKFVYGAGNYKAKAMLIGEGPGAQEDKTGIPFVGDAGQLLDKMLAAINIKREDIYIANIVKCRPPGNRDPHPDEAAACLPYLNEQISLIRPQVILLLGRIACHHLLGGQETLKHYRSNSYKYKGIPVFATYHPAALLRHQAWKRPAWEDLQKFRDFYNTLDK